MCTSAGATSRGQHRPSSSWRLLGDRRDRARDADAVGAHRDRDQLAVLVQHLQVERLGVLAAELEDVADLDAAGDAQRAAADRAGSPARTSAASIGAVAGEVAAGDEVEDVPARLVGAGDPRGAVDDAGSSR